MPPPIPPHRYPTAGYPDPRQQQLALYRHNSLQYPVQYGESSNAASPYVSDSIAPTHYQASLQLPQLSLHASGPFAPGTNAPQGVSSVTAVYSTTAGGVLTASYNSATGQSNLHFTSARNNPITRAKEQTIAETDPEVIEQHMAAYQILWNNTDAPLPLRLMALDGVAVTGGHIYANARTIRQSAESLYRSIHQTGRDSRKSETAIYGLAQTLDNTSITPDVAYQIINSVSQLGAVMQRKESISIVVSALRNYAENNASRHNYMDFVSLAAPLTQNPYISGSQLARLVVLHVATAKATANGATLRLIYRNINQALCNMKANNEVRANARLALAAIRDNESTDDNTYESSRRLLRSNIAAVDPIQTLVRRITE